MGRAADAREKDALARPASPDANEPITVDSP